MTSYHAQTAFVNRNDCIYVLFQLELKYLKLKIYPSLNR